MNDKRYSGEQRKLNDEAKKENELQLELEISESLKNIIASSEKSESVLLDIEIIRPPEARNFKKKEVQTEILEKHLQQKINNKNCIPKVQKISTLSTPIKPPESHNSRKRPGKHRHCNKIKSENNIQYFDIPVVQEKLSSKYKAHDNSKKIQNGKSVVPNFLPVKRDITEQIYASLNQRKVKAIYPCQNLNNAEHNQKYPCPCQNCAIIGILMDSQKRPIHTSSTDNIDLTNAKEKHAENSSINRTSKNENPNDKMNFLLKKVKVLETRIQEQEERSVSRQCFIRIVNKIIEYIDLLDKNEKKKPNEQRRNGSDIDLKWKSPSEVDYEKNKKVVHKKANCKYCTVSKNKYNSNSRGKTVSRNKQENLIGSFYKNQQHLLYCGHQNEIAFNAKNLTNSFNRMLFQNKFLPRKNYLSSKIFNHQPMQTVPVIKPRFIPDSDDNIDPSKRYLYSKYKSKPENLILHSLDVVNNIPGKVIFTTKTTNVPKNVNTIYRNRGFLYQ